VRKVCQANLAGSFPKAARLLEELAAIRISDKQVQLVTERVGRVLADERRRATDDYLRLRQAPSGRPSKSKPFGPALLVISMDGGRVQTRQDNPDDKWKEDKVAVVYEATPSPERPGEDYHGPTARNRCVSATMENWETLADHASALADRRGYATARQKLFLSDGAGSIASQRQRCFPDATFVLDLRHAQEHLHQTAQAALGAGAKAETWYEVQKERLWNGQTDLIIREIARFSRKAGQPPKRAPETDRRRILATNLHYFTTNRNALDYPRFRQNGWPIGSGIIESIIKQIGKRLKGSEKHWVISGAEATLQVMAHLISEDGSWHDFWKRCPLAA
jgi:hypothetical protein